MPPETALKGAQDNLGELIVQHSLDAILLTAPDGRIFMANRAACELFNYSERELLAGGRPLIVDEEDPETAALIAARKRDGYARGEQWMFRRDGVRLRTEVTTAVFTMGSQQRTVVIVRDVGALRQREYEQRLMEAAAADAPLVVCVTDQNWTMLWANTTTERISGYPVPKLIGQTAPLKRHLEAEDPKALAAIEHDLQTHGKWTGEVFTRRHNGEIYPLHGTISAVESLQPGCLHYVAALADVSAVREYERKLGRIALYDPITALPNRTLFEREAGRTLQEEAAGGTSLALMLVDIDGFRAINESLGYEAADRVLHRIAERLRDVIGGETLLSRHTGDSFALLLGGGDSAGRAGVTASEVLGALQKPMDFDGNRFTLTAGIGISRHPEDGITVDRLLQTAEAALQRVKDRGGDGWAFYETGSEQRSQALIALAAPMREGLGNSEFVAHFQPIVDSATMEVTSMETLARWRRGHGSIVSPAEFIPVAERSGLIAEISETLLRQACRHLRVLDKSGYPELRCSVNLSARQFRDPDLAGRILGIVTRERIAPERIVLEITESLIMDRPEEKASILGQLQEHGMQVVIDDFGTGYSSFGYLKHFQVNGIKLDRLFVHDVPGSRKDETLVTMMLAVGRELDIPVVAEGVETAAQASFLREHGCTRLQGFLIAPALSPAQFRSFLREPRARSERPGPTAPD